MEALMDKTDGIETNSGQNGKKLADLKPLSVKHEKVLGLVLLGETPTEAYRRAYSCDSNTAKRASSRLVQNDHFKSHLTLRREAIADANNLNHGWVLGKLKFIVEECLEKGKYFNPAAANKALELIGKNLGTFDKEEIRKEERPAFIGLTINMGNGTMKMIRKGEEPIDITSKTPTACPDPS